MKDMSFNSRGPDATYLTKTNVFLEALFDTAIFKNAWPAEKLGSRSVLEDAVAWYRQKFIGGQTGNRLDIAARKAARIDLDERIRRILAYIAVMGDESDITAMINSNVVTQSSKKRARRTSKPISTN